MSTFKITPEDVGRKVRLRNGLDFTIISIDHETEEYNYPVALSSGQWVAMDGRHDNDVKNHPLDVVAFADDKQPRPKDLRDEFAMVALQGVLGSSLYDEARSIQAHNAGSSIEGIVAHLSYEFADAMMRVREGKV